MADTTTVKYLRPLNLLDGDVDEHSGNRHITVQLTGISDGTGETDVTKIRLSDLRGPNGRQPAKTAVERIKGQVRGLDVLLEWDRAPSALITRIGASGNEAHVDHDWRSIGGNIDPGGDDRTGDILLTTTNADVGDIYTLTLDIRLKD